MSVNYQRTVNKKTVHLKKIKIGIYKKPFLVYNIDSSNKGGKIYEY